MIHPLDDGSLFVDGRLPSTDTYVIAFKSPVKTLTAVRIESLTDPDRFEQGPGRGADQHAMLTGITVHTGARRQIVANSQSRNCVGSSRLLPARICGCGCN